MSDATRTHRLELADSSLREWEATVLLSDPELGIVLDRSAFYPGGGGQPPDHGVLLWGGVQTRIVDVRRGDDQYLVPADGDPLPPVGTPVRGALEDERRTALMRTHSGLHLLSGVVFRDFGALVTGSNMDPLSGRLDFNLEEVPPGFKEAVEAACNAEVEADRAIEAYELDRDDAFAIPDVIRTATNLLPPGIEVVRIVDIKGLDVQADGGTHVASTRQIGSHARRQGREQGQGLPPDPRVTRGLSTPPRTRTWPPRRTGRSERASTVDDGMRARVLAHGTDRDRRRLARRPAVDPAGDRRERHRLRREAVGDREAAPVARRQQVAAAVGVLPVHGPDRVDDPGRRQVPARRRHRVPRGQSRRGGSRPAAGGTPARGPGRRPRGSRRRPRRHRAGRSWRR